MEIPIMVEGKLPRKALEVRDLQLQQSLSLILALEQLVSLAEKTLSRLNSPEIS